MPEASGDPIRIRGTVVHHALGDYLLARDATGSLRVPFRALTYFNPGSQVEVFAFPAKLQPEIVLTNSTVKLVLADAGIDEPAAAILTPSSANPKLPILLKIGQIRGLSAQEASRGYPVRITGVISYWDPGAYLQFVQDDTAGVYLDLSKFDGDPGVLAGTRVEIAGFSGPGSYAPVLIPKTIRSLGASDNPEPVSASFEKLMTGTYDSNGFPFMESSETSG
jgi:hypothetical protein